MTQPAYTEHDVSMAAHAISFYDCQHHLSANGEINQHQRNEARAVLAALAAAGRLLTPDLRDLLSDLTDFGVDPCRYDHHGHCQEHGWMATEPPCPYARAKKLLAQRFADEDSP